MKFFTFLLMLFGLTTGTWLNAQTITGDGSFTFSVPGDYELIMPDDCTADVDYEIWGGGGAGGYINVNNVNTSLRPSPGGGGGAYEMGNTSIAAGTFPIVVGAGGIVSNFETTRENGTASSAFGVTANRGQGGGGGNGGRSGGGGGRDGGGHIYAFLFNASKTHNNN